MTTTAVFFDQPLEALRACHERIERELFDLEGLDAHVRKSGCDAQARSTAEAVLHYFNTAGEMHHKDEDEDLFPLLRTQAAARGRAEIAAVIDELEREHETMRSQWGRLRAGLERIARGDAQLNSEDIARFAWLYRRHMEREAAAVLPFAREALDAAQRAAFGERMAARRERTS